MSDAFSDIKKDREIDEKIYKIEKLEKKFRENDSIFVAEDLINNFFELSKMKKGYHHQISEKLVEKEILKYQKYIFEWNYRM